MQLGPLVGSVRELLARGGGKEGSFSMSQMGRGTQVLRAHDRVHVLSIMIAIHT